MVDGRFTLSTTPVGEFHFTLSAPHLRVIEGGSHMPRGNGPQVAPVPPRSYGCELGTRRRQPPKWWGSSMSRVIAIVACGFTLAACSSLSMPSLSSFTSSTRSGEALRIESEPPGAEAKTSTGQSCRTPCELAVPASGEVSVTLALNGFQPQTVSVRPEAPSAGERDSEISPAGPRLAPNPIYVELQPAPVAPPTRKPPAAKKKKPVTTAARTASTAPVTAAAPAPAVAPSVQTIEPAASATNFPWPTR